MRFSAEEKFEMPMVGDLTTNKRKQTMTTATKSYVDVSATFSMEDLLLGNEQKNDFVENTIISGKVVEKRNDGALIDIGYKSEGFVPAAEFRNWEEVQVGDEIDVFLEETENENSMPGISLQRANFIKAWDKITGEFGENSIIKGLMKRRVKGGIIIDLNGVEAFLPGIAYFPYSHYI